MKASATIERPSLCLKKSKAVGQVSVEQPGMLATMCNGSMAVVGVAPRPCDSTRACEIAEACSPVAL